MINSVQVDLDDGTSVRWSLPEEGCTADMLVGIITSALDKKPDTIKG